MKTIGHRVEQPLALQASGTMLEEGARFSETIARLSGSTFVPKGVFRFRSHEEAEQQLRECVARGMASLAATRDCPAATRD